MSELLMRRRPWMADAACRRRDVDPDWFHPDGWNARGITRVAKTICADCPVATTCLTENLHEPEGVWGGLDPTERKKLREKAAS